MKIFGRLWFNILENDLAHIFNNYSYESTRTRQLSLSRGSRRLLRYERVWATERLPTVSEGQHPNIYEVTVNKKYLLFLAQGSNRGSAKLNMRRVFIQKKAPRGQWTKQNPHFSSLSHRTFPDLQFYSLNTATVLLVCYEIKILNSEQNCF